MNLATSPYYRKMLEKSRLIPFAVRCYDKERRIDYDRMACFITFYITDDITQYVNSEPWKVLEDNPNGNTCYIAQLFTDKHIANTKLSLEIWRRFKLYIERHFPAVEKITWKRWNHKTETVRTYKKEMKKCPLQKK